MDGLKNEDIILSEYFKEKDRKKKYLKRYKKNRACINRLKDKLDMITVKIETIRSPTFSDTPPSKGGLHITMADMISEKVDLERRIERLEKSGNIIKENTYDLIDRITEPKLVEIMELLFIRCYEMDDVADMLGLSKRQLLRNYRLAIDSIKLGDVEEE